jgi:hypothetical protein
MPELGKATYVVEIESRDFERGLKVLDKKTQASAQKQNKQLNGMADDWNKVTVGVTKTSDAVDKNSRSTDRNRKSLRGFGNDMVRVNQALSLFGKVLNVAKIPAFAAAIGYAVKAVNALIAGTLSLVGALGPLAGALVAMPALFGSMAQAMATVTLGFSPVIGVLKEMSSAQERAGGAATSTAKATKSAARSVVSAEKQLEQAHKAVTVAVGELSSARQQAIRDLKDMQLANEGAQLSEERAKMSAQEARHSLAKAEAEGKSSAREIRDMRLGVEEAELGVKESRVSAKRSAEDLDKTERKGVHGSEAMVTARENIASAKEEEASATEALTAATESLEEASTGSSAAASKLSGNLAKLSPQARKFVMYLVSLKSRFQELRDAAGRKMFPGVETGLKYAMKNFPILEKVLERTGGAIGNLGEKAGKLLGSKSFGERFKKIGDSNAKTIEHLGNAGISSVDALSRVLVVARPLVDWMGKLVERFGSWLDVQAKAGAESGRMAKFFERTKEVMTTLGHTLKYLGEAFFNIAKIGSPLGRELLSVFEESALHFKEWTDSVKGRNTIAEYFKEMKPPLWEMGRLLHDVTIDLFGLGKADGLTPFIHALRVEVLPVLTEFLTQTTKSFGPTMTRALVQLIKLASIFAGTSGPLEVTVKAITKMAEAINWIAREVPGAKEVMVTLVGAAAIFKGVKFVGWMTGLTGVVGMLKNVARWLGIIEAEQVAAGGAGGILGGVGGGAAARRTAATTVGEFGEKQALREAGLIGGSTAAGMGMARFQSMLKPWAMKAGAVAAGYFVAEFGAKAVEKITGSDILEGQNLAESLTHGFNTDNVARTEMDAIQQSKGLDFSKSRAELASLHKALAKTMKMLNSSAALGLGSISTKFRMSVKQIHALFLPGSTQFDKAMRKSVNTTVEQIHSGMKAGIIPVKQGRKVINRLLEELHIKQGKDPLKIAEATTKSFKEANQIAPAQVKQWLDKLEAMPKGARKNAMESVNGMVKEWAKGHPKLEAQFKNLTDVQRQRFGKTNKELRKNAAETMKHLAGSAQEGADAVGAALENIGGNLANALSSLGAAKIPQFRILHASASARAREAELNRGAAATGYLPGYGLKDTVPLMAAPGEAVVTRHQQAHINDALSFSAASGRGRYGNLPQLFKGEGTPHYMAKGGIVRQVLSGGGAQREGDQKGLDKVWKAAQRYYEQHNGLGKVVNNGDRMNALHQPYLWGGGHGATPSRMGPWDCSGGISEMLAGAGLPGADFNFAPMVSGAFENWGKPGKGDVTVLANAEHVYSVIKGKGAIGTSESNPGGGFGWISEYDYRPGFVQRHASFDEVAANSRTGGKRGGGKGDKQVKGMAGGGFVGDINHVWSEHNSAEGDWGGPTLPSYVVAALAQSAGAPGTTMEQVTRGESGSGSKNSARPGATGVDPGGTKGLGLWMITTHWNDDKIRKWGGEAAMRNPVRNAAAMKEVYDGQGLGAWYGTGSVTGDGVAYTGAYDVRDALGGRTFQEALTGKPAATEKGDGKSAHKSAPQYVTGEYIKKTKKPGFAPGGFTVDEEKAHYKVQTDPIAFPAIPVKLKDIIKELRYWQRKLPQYKAALKKVKGSNTKAMIAANIKLIEAQIKKLRAAAEKARHAERVARSVARIAKASEFLPWTQDGGMFDKAEERYNSLMETAEQVLSLEPEEPANMQSDWIKSTLEPYVLGQGPHQESGALGAVLDAEAQWRNTILGAEEFAGTSVLGWRDRITKLTDRIKGAHEREKQIRDRIQEIESYKDSNPKAWEKWRGKLPDLRSELKAIPGRIGGWDQERGAYRESIKKTSSETLPEWAEALSNVQGMNATHQRLGALPTAQEVGGFGGLIWDTQGEISGLGLKVKAAEGNIGEGETSEKDSALAELYKQQAEEANKRANVSELLNPVFQEFFSHVPKYGGKFHKGGVVPGTRQEERMVIAQGGEIFAQPDNMKTAGADSDHHHATIIEDGAIDTSKIRDVFGDEARKAISSSRRRVG